VTAVLPLSGPAGVLAAEGAVGGVATTPLLTAAIVLPFIGALAVALVPRSRTELFRPVALLFAGATGALTVWMMAAFDVGEPGFQFVTDRTWIEELGISWHVGVDGISLFLIVLTGLLFPLVMVAVAPHHDPKPYYAWLLVLQAGCIGVFCALDLFMFFVMFEIVLVPMYFLIGGWGYGNRVYAALKFFLYTMLGSAFMLVGIVALAFIHQDAVQEANTERVPEVLAEFEQEVATLQQQAAQAVGPDGFPDTPEEEAALAELQARFDQLSVERDEQLAELRDPALTFDLVEIAETGSVQDTSSGARPWDWGAARWIFLAFAVAFAVKVPLFPVHTWLPDAHTEAPTAGSVILAGVMLKLGTYGFVRLGLYLLPEAAAWFAPAMVALGVVGILYGAVVATMQRDLKRLVAYSSVAHLGFIALGTFAITTQSLQGSVIQMVNHGLSTGALFLLVGMIYERRRTRAIAELQGLQKAAPILAGVFMLVMLSSIGIPGLNGFVGEFLILLGAFLTYRWWAVAAAVGVILAALYLLWAYQRVFHGTPDGDNATMRDMSWKEGLVMAPLVGLIVFLGVYPKPVLERIEPAVDRLVSHVEERSDFVQPEVATVGPAVAGEQAAGEGEEGGD
jgi:NADH:ubiquinone oxidoreductase subunit 4 (subunit M)